MWTTTVYSLSHVDHPMSSPCCVDKAGPVLAYRIMYLNDVVPASSPMISFVWLCNPRPNPNPNLNPNKECCPVGRLGKTLTSQHLGKLLGSQLLGKPLRYNTFGMLLLLLSQLLDKLWSQVSSLLPPGTCLQFLSRIGFSIPTARRLSSNFANSRFRAFRESICAQEKLYHIPVYIRRPQTKNAANYQTFTKRGELDRPRKLSQELSTISIPDHIPFSRTSELDIFLE